MTVHNAYLNVVEIFVISVFSLRVPCLPVVRFVVKNSANRSPDRYREHKACLTGRRHTKNAKRNTRLL